MDDMKKSRKGTYWSLRLYKITRNVITHNTVGFGELTAMVNRLKTYIAVVTGGRGTIVSFIVKCI